MFGDLPQDGITTSSSSLPSDRRENVRHVIKLRVLVAVGKVILQGRSENLSTGGACIFLDEMLAEGTNVAVRILTPHLAFPCIDLRARVQYSTLTSCNPPCRIGMKFMGIDAEAMRRLAALTAE